MRLSLKNFSRFRPRIVTAIVLFVVAAFIALANLSVSDWVRAGDSDVKHIPYGWPLVWHRIVLHVTGLGYAVVGWYYSIPRLLANLLLWFALLTASAAACEWLLRRYRPRLRWSLRTLLVFVAMAAAFCAWYAGARNRAAIQDPLIVSMKGGYGIPLVFVERWGPKWLDLFGIDRFRRRIVLANFWHLDTAEPDQERLFLQLSRLSSVRYITEFHVDNLTPTTAKALGSMRGLHTLGVEFDRLTADVPAALSDLHELRSLSLAQTADTADEDYARLADECLAAIGNMTHLETLELKDLPLRGKGVACLSALTNLKSLRIDFWGGEWKGSNLGEPIAQDCLRAVATLPRLEWLMLEDLRVSNQSLACLAGIEGLKTLSIYELVTDERPMLSHLPPLGQLEALSLWGTSVDDDDLRRLAVLPRLASLSLGGSISRASPISPSGLAKLAAIKTIEELELHDDVESPQAIEALIAVKQLKRLHLNHTSTGPGDRSGELTLDDGKKLIVRDLEGFGRALRVLRKANPGLVIDTEGTPAVWRRWNSGMPDLGEYDSAPERPDTSWLPGGGLAWKTPQELADFEKVGGRASFYGATWPDREGKHLVTAEFDVPRRGN
jgi:hypothetical protein